MQIIIQIPYADIRGKKGEDKRTTTPQKIRKKKISRLPYNEQSSTNGGTMEP